MKKSIFFSDKDKILRKSQYFQIIESYFDKLLLKLRET